MNLLVKVLIQSLAVFVAAYILPGVEIDSFLTLLIVAIVLGILNVFLKPILVLLTLPVTVITFGLFLFIINGVLVLIASAIVPGFSVDGFLWAVLFSIVVSLVSALLRNIEQ